MSRRFVFAYTLADDAAVGEAVPAHVEYWTRAHLENYLGGPFADRSGGLIVFSLTDLESARSMTDGDPFVTRGLIRERWVKEWVPQ